MTNTSRLLLLSIIEVKKNKTKRNKKTATSQNRWIHLAKISHLPKGLEESREQLR